MDGEFTLVAGVAFTVISFETGVLAVPDLNATKVTVYVPAVLNTGETEVVDVEVAGVPPLIVQRTESGVPVDVFVNNKLEPAQTAVSADVKFATSDGAAGFILIHASFKSKNILPLPFTFILAENVVVETSGMDTEAVPLFAIFEANR
jgi:hypothetical protein